MEVDGPQTSQEYQTDALSERIHAGRLDVWTFFGEMCEHLYSHIPYCMELMKVLFGEKA